MQELKFTLTLNEANVILDALGRMPFKDVNDLIGKIQSQGSEQLKPVAVAETTEAQS